MLQKAPFTAPPVEVTRTEQRFDGFCWGEQPSIALLREDDENRHWTRTFVDERRRPAAPSRASLWDLLDRRALQAPGLARVPRSCRTARGSCSRTATRSTSPGDGSSPDGDRPFLDRLDLDDAEDRAPLPQREDARTSGSSPSRARTRSTLPDVAPVADRTRRTRSSARSARPSRAPRRARPRTRRRRAPITHIPDPTPAVRAIKKRLVKYKRKDGVDLSFTLYTPPGLQGRHARPGDPLRLSARLRRGVEGRAGHRLGADVHAAAAVPAPAPRRVRRSSTTRRSRSWATRRRPTTRTSSSSSPTRRRRSTRRWSSASSIPDRIGVTGHSHGALMTANLVAHSDLFRAGRRDERLLQQDAHAVRLPERAAVGLGGAERLPQGVAVLLRRQDEGAAPHRPRRGRREPGDDAAAGDEALRGHPRQRRHDAPRHAPARAALVRGAWSRTSSSSSRCSAGSTST